MEYVTAQGSVPPPRQVDRQPRHADHNQGGLDEVDADLQPRPLEMRAILQHVVGVVEQTHQNAYHHGATEANRSPRRRLETLRDLRLRPADEWPQEVEAHNVEPPVNLDPPVVDRAAAVVASEIAEDPREGVQHIRRRGSVLANVEGVHAIFEPSIGDRASQAIDDDLQPTRTARGFADLEEDPRLQDHDEVPPVVGRQRVVLHVPIIPHAARRPDHDPVVLAPIHRPRPRLENVVHKLRDGEGHAHVHEENEQVLEAQLDARRSVRAVGPGVLVRAEHDETEHVLVIPEGGPDQDFGPRLDAAPRQNGAERCEAIVQ
mmetsp:Transcript_7717/g.22806  ORF Transcript_7717/g.22806 Transcript_7717/m.22806 type:complete len:318 (-) Transcript_7717:371-1324(-)